MESLPCRTLRPSAANGSECSSYTKIVIIRLADVASCNTVRHILAIAQRHVSSPDDNRGVTHCGNVVQAAATGLGTVTCYREQHSVPHGPLLRYSAISRLCSNKTGCVSIRYYVARKCRMALLMLMGRGQLR